MVRNRILFAAVVVGLAVALAGCQPVGYCYVPPVYTNAYYGGYVAPVYAGDCCGGYPVPVPAGGY